MSKSLRQEHLEVLRCMEGANGKQEGHSAVPIIPLVTSEQEIQVGDVGHIFL